MTTQKHLTRNQREEIIATQIDDRVWFERYSKRTSRLRLPTRSDTLYYGTRTTHMVVSRCLPRGMAIQPIRLTASASPSILESLMKDSKKDEVQDLAIWKLMYLSRTGRRINLEEIIVWATANHRVFDMKATS